MADPYDPDTAPDPEAWLALGDDERLLLVEEYHRGQKIRIAGLTVHSVLHATVESQLAMGLRPVADAMERLMGEGLDRHDALHAIGSVLIEHIHGLMQSDHEPGTDPNEAYYHDLRRLTVRRWRERLA